MSILRVITMFGFLFLAACATREVTPSGLNLMSESVYQATVEKYSDTIEVYDGLNNTITIKGTILNSQVAMAQLDQNARLFLWDQTKFAEEKKKTEDNLKKEISIFVSFYTPTRKHDDLHKSKTLWKIFLDAEGRRFEGKATKIKLLTEEVRRLYWYHGRFTTPYTLTFQVPAALVERTTSKLTITGPVGSASLNFPALAAP